MRPSGVHSPAVSKSNKRERQRQNREAGRAALEAAKKRQRTTKTIRNVLLVVVPLALLLVALNVFGGSDEPAKAAKPRKKAGSTVSAKEASSKPPTDSPALQIDPNETYTATIETTEGTITASLDAKNAKWGANNFVTLARKGAYDGTSFHRVAKDFVIQGGDPNGDGSGGPGYTFVSELPKKGFKVGDLAYAKTGQAKPGSAGSQFFIITDEQALTTFNTKPYLYGVFGRVTGGSDVVDKIAALVPESGDGPPTKPVKMTKVTIDGPPSTIEADK